MEERLEAGDEGGLGALADRPAISNVLVHAPALDSGGDDACFDLLSATPPAATSVLAVTYTRPPAAWVDAWNAHVGTQPARSIVVSVGRSPETVDDPAWSVVTVENARDLTTLGVEITGALSDLAAAGETVALCFDSVTALLQYAGRETVLRFLHVVAGHVDDAGGMGHYHVDPAAHGERDLAALAGIVDAVADVADDGAVAVRR